MTQDGNQPASGALDHGRTLEFGFFLDPAAKAPAVRQRVDGARALSPRDALTEQRQLT
jgi:hypothetical protein